jgi:hypothetical protein
MPLVGHTWLRQLSLLITSESLALSEIRGVVL